MQTEATNIAIVGTGYVGLAMAALFARQHSVIALDIDPVRVDAINAARAPLADPDIAAFLATRPPGLRATLDPAQAFKDAQWVIVATPTDHDPRTGAFDASSVEAAVAQALQLAPLDATIVIKSTVPVGFTQGLRERHGTDRVLFSPEFLREGRALHDNLHPSRIVVGDRGERGARFAAMLAAASERSDVPVQLTGSTEAEAVKLFANTYLAMRVAFFNELDSYAAAHGLDPREIVDGVCLDPRIGAHYNNPSFGYGGYCLPKDTRQLLANYQDVPQNLIRAVVESNATRMDFIAEDVMRCAPRVVGIHRLVMKAGSDNFRASSVLGVMERLRARGVALLIHEPALTSSQFRGVPVENDLAAFKAGCDLILANRRVPELEDVAERVYSRDLFGGDA